MTTTHKTLLNEDDLRAWLKYDRGADIEAKLREMGIKFRVTGKGIVTTLAAVDRAFAGNDDFADIQFGRPDGSQAQQSG